METTRVKAIELVMDWSIWPRQSAQRLDSTNVGRMKESLRSGFPLPPIIVDRKTLRIVDGFHRTQAVLSVFGDDAEIEAILKDYKNDAEMFLEAGATNHHHGLPMSPKDRAHFISVCRRMKIPWPAIAGALNMDQERVKAFVKARTAQAQNGETIALPAGAQHLAGKKLTSSEEYYVRSEQGFGGPSAHVSILMNAIRANSVIPNERTIEQMRELHQLIADWLAEVE
jgi:hypothetical protein